MCDALWAVPQRPAEVRHGLIWADTDSEMVWCKMQAEEIIVTVPQTQEEETSSSSHE